MQKAYYSSSSTVNNVLSRAVLVLLPASSHLCFLFGDHMCPVSWSSSLRYRAEGTRLTNEDLDGHHHSRSAVKDLSIGACVIHPKFLYDRSTFLAYLGQEFVQMKTLPGKKYL